MTVFYAFFCRFVSDIFKKAKPETSDELIRRIKFRIPKVPQQKDSTECGFYVLFYIYRFLMACPDQFNIKEDYPSFVSCSCLFLCEVFFFEILCYFSVRYMSVLLTEFLRLFNCRYMC